ncbi:MAG TPA: protein kinase [Blastocatellia bacterium]|nr:protein kinase [Blastocatellia bacterium]
MAPERWKKVETLYLAALEREADERDAFLAEACAEDESLRREVESLIHFHERADNFIEAPALEVAAQLEAESQKHSLIGRHIGPYQILSLLGAGGMGEVYRALDSRLDREVAIKVLPSHLAQDTEALTRFKREARAVAALSHPNILAIHDFGTEQDVSYAVMELLEGETLRSRLRHAALPWRKAVEIGIGLAEGLSAAHAKGITHRDLKPENIFLTTAGQVKILDFGIARVERVVSPDAETKIGIETTRQGVVMGTIGYMSPEQLRGEKAEAPSDIFSFGCVFYEMVAGRRAFARPTEAETMAAILKDEPPELVQTGSSIPHELEQVARRCLEKSPAERFQSARDLSFALRVMLSGAGASARSARRIGPALWGGVAFLVTLAVIVAWRQPWRRLPSGQTQQRLISSFPGSHREASFSPDGSLIAFINDSGGVPQVWVKNLAGGDPIPITTGELPAHRPRWSPKNDQILFSRGGSVWSAAPLGGIQRKVIEGGDNANWSWDGSRLVYEKDEQIWTARADGSEQRKVEGVPTPDNLLADRAPAFSPDGSLIAFFQCSKGPIGDIWIIPSAGGQPRRLTYDDHFGGAPAWTPDGRFIIFSSLRAGSRTLWKIPVSGAAPEPVLVSAGEDLDPELSRDGRQLIYTNTRNSFILTVWNPVTNHTRELMETRYDLTDPSFSPQGDKISFFLIENNGDIQIRTIDLDGGASIKVTRADGERNIHPRWSPDGLWLFFYQIRPTLSIRKISISGGQSFEVAAGWAWGTHYAAQVDPQGKLIVYEKREKGQPRTTVIREIETGKETDFKTSFNYPQWSKDGKAILGVDRISGISSAIGQISICSVEAVTCRKLTDGQFPRWSRDGSRIFFLRPRKSGEGKELWTISAKGGDANQIGELRTHPIGPFFDVSPKGEIVYVRFNPGKSELWLTDFPGP